MYTFSATFTTLMLFCSPYYINPHLTNSSLKNREAWGQYYLVNSIKFFSLQLFVNLSVILAPTIICELIPLGIGWIFGSQALKTTGIPTRVLAGTGTSSVQAGFCD